jgi:hypothetical protein
MKKNDMEDQHMEMMTPHCCLLSCRIPYCSAGTSARAGEADVGVVPAPSSGELELKNRCGFGRSSKRYRLAIVKKTVMNEVTHPGL